jgi:hypothetical protein
MNIYIYPDDIASFKDNCYNSFSMRFKNPEFKEYVVRIFETLDGVEDIEVRFSLNGKVDEEPFNNYTAFTSCRVVKAVRHEQKVTIEYSSYYQSLESHLREAKIDYILGLMD